MGWGWIYYAYIDMHTCIQVAWAVLWPTHQGCSCCLGRCKGQMCQHLFHLCQLLSTDIICIWDSGRCQARCSLEFGAF